MVNLVPWRRREGGELAERPEHPLFRLRDDFTALWDRFLSDWSNMAMGTMPALAEPLGAMRGLDIDDRENEMVVRAEAPGFEPGEFNVQVMGDNTLMIRAEHKEEKKEEGREAFRMGRVQRMVTLPPGIEPDKIEAKYRNGVLEIHVPKGEQAKGKRITVQSQ